jgi:MYXO-CTERM domain-containing protein
MRIAASALLFALGMGISGGVARAAVINFSYSGGGVGNFIAIASGSGSFTTDNSNPATINDLSSFVFTLSVTDGDGDTDTLTYGLGDLQSFSATFSGGTVTGLSLTTDYQDGWYYPDEAFTVTDLGVGGANSFNGDTGPITVGTITANESSTPEPAPLALIPLGLLGLAAVRRRLSHR